MSLSLMVVPPCLNYNSFVVGFEVGMYESFNFILPFKIILAIFGLCMSLGILGSARQLLLKDSWSFDVNCIESVGHFG